ncbi:MAG: Acylase ACY 1 proenzyme [Chroococcopsis gigantea SAG 12.99]|jgi:gamma-glutamyltranspeptidase/glutathione hydrolase|nr:gamma-glutamyltransferase [Chlorogloea purpurea SAG 13.99]MDV2998948.1 Acylase ACY 1 proenzyme [Chroococcopsis gigantea SAG 12.99]
MTSSQQGIIAAGHPKTVEAGQHILEMGGNAFDAACASVLAAFVVESTLCSPGGGGFLLAHTKEKVNKLYDFFCQTPRQKKPLQHLDFYPVYLNFGGAIQEFHIGLGSIATPGAIKGVYEAHRELGRLPFREVIQPAINYARNGFTFTSFNAFSLQLLDGIMTVHPDSRKVYAPLGNLLKAGDSCYMNDLAYSLTQLAEEGLRSFYEDNIAGEIIKDLSDGGHLIIEDLQEYQVIPRQPLKISYRGYEIITNPPPSSGGILMAFALKVLEEIDLKNLEYQSSEHIEILAKVMALTNSARQEGYDQNIYQNSIETQFLDPEFISEHLNKWGSTTHISVMDREGNAASVTVSNGEGSGYTIPRTGIMLNNMLGEADLNPSGFHQWPTAQRLSSMMSPTMILKDGEPLFVLGSGGSNRIRTAILQVISNLIDFGQSLDRAISNPRIHWENNILNIEPLPESIVNALTLPPTTEVCHWQETNLFFGGVHGVGLTSQGQLCGAGDYRRHGVAG